MTGNLEMLMKMREAKIKKEANVQTAEDIGKKAELGYFDVEFTMYGCAYWDRSASTMAYRISSRAADIYDYIENAARIALYPSQVERLTLTCPVRRWAPKSSLRRTSKKSWPRSCGKGTAKHFLRNCMIWRTRYNAMMPRTCSGQKSSA